MSPARSGSPDPGEHDPGGSIDDETVIVDRYGATVRMSATQPDAPETHAAEPDPDTGSTVVVRRESRRRALAAGSSDDEADADVTVRGRAQLPTPPADELTAGRIDRVAAAPVQGAAYGPRVADPVRVQRTPPPPRAPQAPVDSGAAAAHARRRSVRALVLLGVISLVIAAAIVVLVVTLL